MNLKKFIPDAISSKVARQALQVQKASPNLLFGAGIVGVVGATVLACRATLKVEEIVDEAAKKKIDIEAVLTDPNIKSSVYSEQDARQDMAVLYIQTAVKFTKLYAPAVGLGALSIFALCSSHNILTKRNAALAAAYAALDKGFKEYRNRVIAEYGEDKDRELKYGYVEREIVEETETGPEVKRLKVADPNGRSVYARFFDEASRNWKPNPAANLMFIRCQQNYANDLLKARGHVFLNEVYDMLDVPRTPAGAVVGWVLGGDGDNVIDFGLYDGKTDAARDFINGWEKSILLDFNVDGVVYDKI